MAPGYDDDALATLTAKANLRVLTAPAARAADARRAARSTAGCSCRQPDPVATDRAAWWVVTERRSRPPRAVGRPAVRLDGVRGVSVERHRASPRTARRSASAPASRTGVDSARIAADRAGGRAVGGVCASDAYFPFRDGLDVAADAGVTASSSPAAASATPR